MRKPLPYTATAEDRRVARKWTCTVLAVYAAFALLACGVVSIRHYFANGSKDPLDSSSTTVTTATARSEHLDR